MTKFIVSLLAICLFVCAATANPSKQYARCIFPDNFPQAQGVFYFKKAGDKLVGRSNIYFRGGDKSVEVELTRAPKRDNCERLKRLVDVIDTRIIKNNFHLKIVILFSG